MAAAKTARGRSAQEILDGARARPAKVRHAAAKRLDVRSRGVVKRVGLESVRLLHPDLAEVFVGCGARSILKALQREYDLPVCLHAPSRRSRRERRASQRRGATWPTSI